MAKRGRPKKVEDVKAVKTQYTPSTPSTTTTEPPKMSKDAEVNDTLSLPDKKLLRVYEVAQYFGVHERTIRLWIDHGKLIAEKPAGIIFITRESIRKFRLSGLLH